MPNDYFNFKQFTVQQGETAMKVCTDACLFGAWLAAMLQLEAFARTILDVGAGTGLLSLMLAQKTSASIDAIEIEPAAAQQASENFLRSPWAHRLKVLHGDYKNIQLLKKYDVVIANPPFYEHDLKSNTKNKNIALHSSHLSLNELLATTASVLTTSGKFALLLPYHRTQECIKLAAIVRLFPQQIVKVQQTPLHSAFRAMILFSGAQAEPIHSNIILKADGHYTFEFTVLLKDYYLHL